MNPSITVLIPTFNRVAFLSECIESILAQTLAPSQIIVIDDGSTDRTAEILSRHSPRIEYVGTPQLGRPGAINAGLKKVSGDYLWIFDDDDVALPDALERFVRPLEKYSEYGFSYSTYWYTENGTDGRIGNAYRESTIPDLKKRGCLIPLLEANYLGGAALFARSSVYKEVGDFDPALLRSQDYEMAIRITRRFAGIRIEGPPTFHYRQHAGARGSLRDMFPAAMLTRKWLEYDQISFRRLYRELPLADYLPPGVPLKGNERRALLQRMAILSSKILIPEIMKDLSALAALPYASGLSLDERQIIRGMIIQSPYYRTKTLLDHSEPFRAIGKSALTSPTLQPVRKEIRAAFLKRCLRNPRMFEFKRNLRRLGDMFF